MINYVGNSNLLETISCNSTVFIKIFLQDTVYIFLVFSLFTTNNSFSFIFIFIFVIYCQRSYALSTVEGYSGYGAEQGEKVCDALHLLIFVIFVLVFHQEFGYICSLSDIFLLPSFLTFLLCLFPGWEVSYCKWNFGVVISLITNDNDSTCWLVQQLRAAIAKTYYENLGIEEDDVFVSDGAKSDISRLQVWIFFLSHLIVMCQLIDFYFRS